MYMKAPESLYSIVDWFQRRKMACHSARLELRKAVKLLQTTKVNQTIDFLERMPPKGNWE